MAAKTKIESVHDSLGQQDEEEDDLVLEENEDDEAGPLLEDNDLSDGSDDGLFLEDNSGTDGEDEELMLQDNSEDADSESSGAQAMPSVKRAEALRAEGNAHFKAGRMDAARLTYSSAIAASPPRENSARATILTNRAAASLKLSDWTAAINDCTAALTLTAIAPESRAKALFRRATAFAAAGDVESAQNDLLELPPADAAVARLRRQIDAAAQSAVADGALRAQEDHGEPPKGKI